MKFTYAVGHLALGYLLGKATSKLLNTDVNFPLLFVVSVISDIDIFIPVLEHRGPTHSLIIVSLLFLPIFILHKREAAPYFVATTQHFLIGDYLTGGSQLLWPFTSSLYGIGIQIASLTNIWMEWILFLSSLTIFWRTKDVGFMLQPHLFNLFLFIPIVTVILPPFLSFPLVVPLELFIPHITYLIVFTLSILIDFRVYFPIVLRI